MEIRSEKSSKEENKFNFRKWHLFRMFMFVHSLWFFSRIFFLWSEIFEQLSNSRTNFFIDIITIYLQCERGWIFFTESWNIDWSFPVFLRRKCKISLILNLQDLLWILSNNQISHVELCRKTFGKSSSDIAGISVMEKRKKLFFDDTLTEKIGYLLSVKRANWFLDLNFDFLIQLMKKLRKRASFICRLRSLTLTTRKIGLTKYFSLLIFCHSVMTLNKLLLQRLPINVCVAFEKEESHDFFRLIVVNVTALSQQRHISLQCKEKELPHKLFFDEWVRVAKEWEHRKKMFYMLFILLVPQYISHPYSHIASNDSYGKMWKTRSR